MIKLLWDNGGLLRGSLGDKQSVRCVQSFANNDVGYRDMGVRLKYYFK